MVKNKIIHLNVGAITLSKSMKISDLEEYLYSTWATRFAKRTMNFTDEYEIECWVMYNSDFFGDQGIFKREKWGITFRGFPGRVILLRLLSFSLLKELNQQIKNRKKILVHLQGLHDLMPAFVAHICKDIPLVAQQRGGSIPSSWRLRCKKKYRYFIKILFDELTIRNFDFIFASSKGEVNYIGRKLGLEKVIHLKGGGFNFERYKPLSRHKAREELGLSQGKKIMLHVSRFKTITGVDNSIAIYNELNKKYDVEMIFIGGNEENPLYDDVMRSGALVKGRIPRDELVKYISASDVHIMPTTDVNWIPYGDIPTVLIESLALNRPVVSAALIHFSGNLEERRKLGFVTKNKEEALEALEFIFANPDNYRNTREIIRKYYNWETIVSKNCKVYNQLLNQYYE